MIFDDNLQNLFEETKKKKDKEKSSTIEKCLKSWLTGKKESWLTLSTNNDYLEEKVLSFEKKCKKLPETHVALNLLGFSESEVRLCRDILAPWTLGPRSGGVIRKTESETRPRTTLMTNTEMQMPFRFCCEGMTATNSWNRVIYYHHHQTLVDSFWTVLIHHY